MRLCSSSAASYSACRALSRVTARFGAAPATSFMQITRGYLGVSHNCDAGATPHATGAANDRVGKSGRV